MAQLKDLIVTGSTRHLGKTYFENDAIFNGSVTLRDTLILAKAQDLSGTGANSPALIVGGLPSEAHIEIDGNEIHAKKNATTVDSLYLNNDGGTVYISGEGGLSASKIVTTNADAYTGADKPIDIKVAGGISVAQNSYFAGRIYVSTYDATDANAYYILGNGTTRLYALNLKNNLSVAGTTTLSKKLTVSDGGITVTKGGIGITAGGLSVTAGGISITAGSLSLAASNNITLANGNITLTKGNVTLSAGNLSVTGESTLKGKVKINNGDASTSTATGDLQVSGGIGIAKASFFADKIYTGTYNSDASKAYYIMGNSTSRLYALTLANNLTVGGTTSLQALSATNISCTTLTSTGKITAGNALEVSKGNLTVATGNATITQGSLTVGGKSYLGDGTASAATASSSTASGAVQVTGGIYVTKDSYFGANVASTSMATGSVKVKGGIGASGQISAQQVMVNDKATMKYDTTNNYLYFVFA
jgi:hypothetical protein